MRQRGPRIKIRYIAVLVMMVWAIYFYWNVQHRQLVALTDKANALKVQLAASQKEHSRLVNMANEFQNPTYIQRYAAEHFNLILPNQVAFTVQH